MPLIWLFLGALMGTVSGAAIGLALVAADCTEPRQFDGCGVFAGFTALVLGIIGAVVAVPVFAVSAAKRWWTVYAMLMEIMPGVFVGGGSREIREDGDFVFRDRTIVIPVINMYNNLYGIDGLLYRNHGERSRDADPYS